MGRRMWIGVAGLALLAVGCTGPEKPTDAETKSARASNPAMRSIDKSRTVANDASERTDDPALH